MLNHSCAYYNSTYMHKLFVLGYQYNPGYSQFDTIQCSYKKELALRILSTDCACTHEVVVMLFSTVLTLLVLIATIYKCRAAHHYYVTATDGSDCPPTFSCHPLNYYVLNADSYFTSNTVVEFLSGLHVFNYTGHVIISYARNLTLIGSDSHVNTSTRCSHSDSIVFCTNYSGFLFVGINGLNIIKLHFTHCGAALPFPELQSSFLVALAVFHMRNLVISRVTVEKSYGYGLHVSNVWNKSVITDSCFISNNEYVSIYQRCIRPASCTGGNLYVFYNDSVLLDTPVSSSSLDINNSEFWRGVDAIESEQHLGLAGGLTIQVGVVNHMTSTSPLPVIAENSAYGGWKYGHQDCVWYRACYSQA